MKYRLCVSSSIIGFREKAEKTWGLKRYQWPRDILKPVVFFGMYHIGDYFHFIRHPGKKIIIWAGNDILNLKRNYLFNDGKLLCLSRLFFKIPAYKLFKKTECYCENELERDELKELGIEAKVRPTFLEDIDDFPISFKQQSKNPQVFISTNKNREKEYGWEIIMKIAEKLPEITFHFYGSCKCQNRGNIIFHGRVSPEQFNQEIKNYHCGLRLNEHDGFSEITAKSVLMGQYPISRIKYPMIDSYETEEELTALLKELKNKKEPNYKAREFWRKNVNQFPWVNKKE